MSGRSKLLFLLLVFAQVAHSFEEYSTQLFEVFAPARLVSGLVSQDLAVGFIIVNAAFIFLMAWSYVQPVRAGGATGRLVAAVWVAIELANGAGHLVMAALRGGYFAGLFTAVLLVVIGAWLGLSLAKDRRRDEKPGVA